MNIRRFDHKHIAITGAGTGMGKAAAIRLASEGAHLALIGRRREPLEQLALELQAMGAEALVLACDISDGDSRHNAFAEITARFGKLDGCFANAGILGEFLPLSATPEAHFDTLLNTNLKGTVASIQHCLPLMSAGSSIVINASWTASAVMPGSGAYAASKGALLSLMRVLAIEQGAAGIRVNAVSPGIILTPMADEVLDPELSRTLAHQAALKRNGTPEDVSGTVAWLLSNDSAFVTGQDIRVDGGFTLGGIRL
jgi:NAD(P)-dependent dehydrogenase (short-subunit alcohol dehydrogenase family)